MKTRLPVAGMTLLLLLGETALGSPGYWIQSGRLERAEQSGIRATETGEGIRESVAAGDERGAARARRRLERLRARQARLTERVGGSGFAPLFLENENQVFQNGFQKVHYLREKARENALGSGLLSECMERFEDVPEPVCMRVAMREKLSLCR